MRERRLKDGNTILFDARDVLDGRKHKGQVVVKMKTGPISYTTEEGVRFWRKHPYQWTSPEEAEQLVKMTTPEFQYATKEDVEDYYAED